MVRLRVTSNFFMSDEDEFLGGEEADQFDADGMPIKDKDAFDGEEDFDDLHGEVPLEDDGEEDLGY
jgi:hypothetical protein